MAIYKDLPGETLTSEWSDLKDYNEAAGFELFGTLKYPIPWPTASNTKGVSALVLILCPKATVPHHLAKVYLFPATHKTS